MELTKHKHEKPKNEIWTKDELKIMEEADSLDLKYNCTKTEGKNRRKSEELSSQNDRSGLDQIVRPRRDRLLRRSVSESLGKSEHHSGAEDEETVTDEPQIDSNKSDSRNIIPSRHDDEDLSDLFQKVLKLDDTINFCKPRRWSSQLTHEQSQVVEQILNKTRATNDLPGASCTVEDLSRLAPNRWLNDELINFYGIMINLRSIKHAQNSKFYNVHCFSSFFMTRFDHDGYQAVQRWTKKEE